MMDELQIDPFERRHVGSHNAFVFRTNHAHVEHCRAVLGPNMGRIYDVPVPKLSVVKRRAA
jgi:hypothetical protein